MCVERIAKRDADVLFCCATVSSSFRFRDAAAPSFRSVEVLRNCRGERSGFGVAASLLEAGRGALTLELPRPFYCAISLRDAHLSPKVDRSRPLESGTLSGVQTWRSFSSLSVDNGGEFLICSTLPTWQRMLLASNWPARHTRRHQVGTKNGSGDARMRPLASLRRLRPPRDRGRFHAPACDTPSACSGLSSLRT